MTEETKDDQAAKLLGDIKQELRNMRSIQQNLSRNFNAVVVLILFGLLMFLVNLFLGDIIRREMGRWVRTEKGEVVGERLEQLGERLGGQ